MASTPTFASVGRLAVVDVSTANTARDGTGTIANCLTGVAAGTRIERVILKATGDPADSVITIFLHDGTTAHLFDEHDPGNPAAASTTVAGYRFEVKYNDLILPSTSWSIRFAITVALTAGVIKAWVLGADLT